MSYAADRSGFNTVTIVVLALLLAILGGVLNNLLQISILKKGRYTWHSVLSHCFPDDTYYILRFAVFASYCYRGVSFFCVLMLTYVLSIFH